MKRDSNCFSSFILSSGEVTTGTQSSVSSIIANFVYPASEKTTHFLGPSQNEINFTID